MTRTVYCKKLLREAEGLDEPPIHGPMGRELYEHVSKEAWQEWTELSVKIVNEYHLDLAEKEHRKVLKDQMRTFFNLDGTAGAVMSVGTPTEEAALRPEGPGGPDDSG